MENKMTTEEIKKSIKRHLKSGTFTNITVNKEQLTMTYKALNVNNPFTYIEKHSDGMLVLDTARNRLTIYTLK